MSLSLRYTSTWLKREWSQLFTGATGVSGEEVGTDYSNKLGSNEQVYVGEIDEDIPSSRQHEFYPTTESRDVWIKSWCSTQRMSSILVCVGGMAKRSSSPFNPSYDCRCTNAILRKHVCSLSSYDGSDTSTRCGPFYTVSQNHKADNIGPL